MSFSAEWLALREPVDHASRNAGLAATVAAHFAERDSMRIVDLGCGTGSNLRATFRLLPPVQDWTLVDYDPALLRAARASLAAWADTAEADGDRLHLSKDGRRISIHFFEADLNRDLEAALSPPPDLVTASALFDLISPEWIARFARAVARRNAAFYTVLTYNGEDGFAPAHPHDGAVVAAFAAHQGGDKGFGPAAGPKGADVLAAAFRDAGMIVREGESPWRIGPDHAALAAQLLEGIAGAVRETGALDSAALRDWLDFRLARRHEAGALIITGHRDTFAVPA